MLSRSQTPVEAKSEYNKIQRGGDVPHFGLRIGVQDTKGKSAPPLESWGRHVCGTDFWSWHLRGQNLLVAQHT